MRSHTCSICAGVRSSARQRRHIARRQQRQVILDDRLGQLIHDGALDGRQPQTQALGHAARPTPAGSSDRTRCSASSISASVAGGVKSARDSRSSSGVRR